MTDSKLNTSKSSNPTFFGPIIKITLISMVGTFSLGWGLHLIGISIEKKYAQADVKAFEFRINQMRTYQKVYKESGRASAITSLANQN